MSDKINRIRIKKVCQALDDLKDSVVFVGGVTLSLYDQSEAMEVRETKDVDLIIEITSYSQQIDFEEELRRRGFIDDTTSKIRGRFKIGNITVDAIPTIDVHMGFENIWYPQGYRNAMVYQLDEETTIKILTAPYFIATKFEAFKSRGGRDPRSSHDFEDIVHVLEYREDIWSELMETEGKLNAYLKKEFKAILDSPDVEEWIDCHVDFTSPPSTYFIMDELRKFAD